MPDDDEFASLVFDEDFVRSAEIHEPSARERMLAAAQALAAADIVIEGQSTETDPYWDEDDPDGTHRRRRPHLGRTRWHRSVAWILAVVMGVGVVALTFAAVYRSAGGGGGRPAVPTPTSGTTGPASGRSIPPVAATRVP